MVAVILYDMRHYIIPNLLNLMLLALYPVFLILSPESVDWLSGIYAMLIIFVVGFVIFSFKLMGGGDVKLLCVCALWIGLNMALIDFVVYTSILGGALAIILIVVRPLAILVYDKFRIIEKMPRIMQHGEPLPYGLAIAIAFLIIIWSNKISGLIAIMPA